MIGFGRLFGLQDIYDGDEVRTQWGAEQAGNSSSAYTTEKKWQDQVDGVSDKWRKGVKKTVHFGEVRRTPKENKDEDGVGEKAVATLSLSVQLLAGDTTTGEKGWREQSPMSQLLENLRRAAEVFADPKDENEVSKD